MTVMLRSVLVFAFAVPAIVAGAAIPPDLRTVSVDGFGEIRVVPDEVSFFLGVSKEAPSPAKARASMARTARKIIASLERNGVAEKDMRTAQASVRPRYERSGGESKIIGYQASTTISVLARDVSGYDRLVSAATEAGATDLQGVHFSHSQLRQIEEEARKKAVEDAFARARLFATAAGSKLGKIQSIEELPSHHPQPHPGVMSRAAAEAPEGPSLVAGEIAVAARVHAVWRLID